MTIGLQLFIIATVMWGALVAVGEDAPRFLWSLIWLPVGITGLVLVWLSYRMTGREMP